MLELPRALFDIYALSLPRGHGFGERVPVFAWQGESGRTCGAATRDYDDGLFGILVMRRRVDDVWSMVATEHGLPNIEAAKARIEELLRDGDPPEPVPPGVRRRARLGALAGRMPSRAFKMLAQPSHEPAAWLLNQLYLAMPNPDRNWASDCQTANFHTRLWEAQLLASLREQGLLVSQPHESPDFRIENRAGGEAWIEVVTANPPTAYEHVNSPYQPAPEDKEELFFGAPAVRFAKTIGSKLERRYADLAHVAGKPFAIALADFQSPASMTWSRESLIGYLYGEGAKVTMVDGVARPEVLTATHLKGATGFEAGLFRDARAAELSAVIFTNACAISKLNRVMVSMGLRPPGYRYIRIGNFLDPSPQAYEPIPFRLDVAGTEYRSLWPHTYEPWTAELQVFHNPFARHPLPQALLPEATHWFKDADGELAWRAHYGVQILSSVTFVRPDGEPDPTASEIRQRLQAPTEDADGAAGG